MSTLGAVQESLLRPRPTRVLPFVAASVAGHVVLTALGLILSWAMAGPKVQTEQTPIRASLVRQGKKRDERLLPRKEEPPPPQRAEPVAVATTAPPTKPAAIAPTAEKAQPKKSLSDAFKQTARKADEPEGEEDGDPSGDSATQEGERYFGLLQAAVKRYYDVSDTIPEAERAALRASVSLTLARTGEVKKLELVKSSGNAQFDDAVLAAVRRASPFPPPPEHLRESLEKTGVSFEFRP